LFPRIITVKRGGHTYRYLVLVESYREKGKVKQRQVGHLGNIDQYSQEEILRLINKLREFLKEEELGTVKDLQTFGTKHYGIPYVVNFFWERLDLDAFFKNYLQNRQLEMDVALCAKVMILNRLIAPKSKLGVSQWLKQIYLPELEEKQPELHHFYRTLDVLEEMKDELERHLYSRLTDLLSYQLNLVFYDLTSSYFEGTRCPLARFGYSRDRRPDCRQINIGLLVTPEGLPIAHQVFEGNIPDKVTVASAIEQLKQKFAIGSCIFVGDRGMLTSHNLEELKEANFRYILGFHKRGRGVSDELLARYQNLEEYQLIDGDNPLFCVEVPAEQVQAPAKKNLVEGEERENVEPPVRYILCHNPLKAQEDYEFRAQAIEEARIKLQELKEGLARETPRRGRKPAAKGVMLKVAAILNKKGLAQIFDITYDGKSFNFEVNEQALAKEALRDGKFLIQTNADLPAKEVIAAYKNLLQVETAFRHIKDFIRLRPIYHYNESRVKGHVFICVLAYLFEKWVEVMHRRYIEGEILKAKQIPDPESQERELRRWKEAHKSGRRILELLEEIKAVDQQFLNKRIYSITQPGHSQSELLKILGLPLPPKILTLR
jgi:transposase